jgi:lipoyl(octanoyl) transferase
MIEIQNWGIIDFKEAWDKQKKLVREIQEKRDRNVLVLCQHPTVITIGRNGSDDNITVNKDFLKQAGIPVYEIDRGGDVTLHNLGQIVGYPVFNLSSYREDLHWFLREIEEAIIELVALYGITAGRSKGLTGVWVDGERKICAMGLHSSRWVTYHGFALNVTNDLSEFGYIVPCGIRDKAVTSVSLETPVPVEFDDVLQKCADIFKKRF